MRMMCILSVPKFDAMTQEKKGNIASTNGVLNRENMVFKVRVFHPQASNSRCEQTQMTTGCI